MAEERDKEMESERREIRRAVVRDGENRGKAGVRERVREGPRYREEKETKGIETGDKPLIVEERCSERRG